MEKKFISILEKLVEMNRILLDLFKEEKQALLANDIEKIKSLNTKQIERSLEVKDIEKEREALIVACISHFDIQVKQLRIDDLILYFSADKRSHILNLASELKFILKDLMHFRDMNNQLINKMLKFNEKNIDLFMRLGKQELTYNDKGKVSQSNRSVFDNIV